MCKIYGGATLNMRKSSSCCYRDDITNGSAEAECIAYTPSAVYSRRDCQTIFYCCGPPNKTGSFNKRHGMYMENPIDLPEAFSDGDEGDVVDIANPAVPYVDKIPVDLFVGRSIEVYGKTLSNCHRFSINLSTGIDSLDDLALHINPRLDRRVIVRNHRIGNKWGTEEIISVQPFPLRMNKNFSILLFVADEQFMIAVNKVHFCAFVFRIPLERITHIVITGDIFLQLIQYTTRNVYPPVIFSKTPFVIVPRLFEKSEVKCDIRRKVPYLVPGTKIEVFGRLKLLPRGFYLNIQNGMSLWPHPIIPFHMNLRLHPPGTHKNEHEIIFNSWYGGGWEKESSLTVCPFMPGSDFHISIDCSPTYYIVEVNGMFLHKHARADVPVDCVFIFGDVVIYKVVLKHISVYDTVKKKTARSSTKS